MFNNKKLITELKTLKDLKTAIESYEEIAAMRTRKVKKSVLQSRDFLYGLSDLYRRVIYTYKIFAQRSKEKIKDIKLLETNGKTVSILIASNTGLYGEIIKNTFELFAENVVNNSHDIVIVGRIGKQMYDSFPGKRNYKFFESNDTGINTEKNKEILEYILPYTNIVAYHGIFVSMLSQKPIATFITGKALDSESHDTKIEELKCIVEPSIEEVTRFFEKQILSSIFEQTIYESSLSKFASRMISLDYANENISVSLRKNSFARLKTKHMNENFDQIERLSGINLWN